MVVLTCVGSLAAVGISFSSSLLSPSAMVHSTKSFVSLNTTQFFFTFLLMIRDVNLGAIRITFVNDSIS